MIIPLAAALVASSPTDDAGLNLCRPALAHKAEGQIASIEVVSTSLSRGRRIIEGRFTAFLGMGPAQPGYASTHHLIRADFIFSCTLGRHGLRSVKVTPRQ